MTRGALLLLVALAGCSSSSGSSSSGGNGAAKWSAFCDHQATQYSTCGIAAPTDCRARATCEASLLKPAALDTATACLLARPCDGLGNDDACLVPAAALPADRQAWLDLCQSTVASCKTSGVAVFDDNCAAANPNFKDEVFATAKACFTKPCAEINPCMNAYFASIQCQ